jgi:hypothetical protein
MGLGKDFFHCKVSTLLFKLSPSRLIF